jgi:major vault protein
MTISQRRVESLWDLNKSCYHLMNNSQFQSFQEESQRNQTELMQLPLLETSDHAKLKLELSYNWYFRIKDNTNQEDLIKIFEVRDFVGDACSTIASRVRGHVAGLSFENFHRFSAKAIRTSIFGLDKEGKVKNDYEFVQNGLIISNIDIRKVEPID